MVTDSEKELDKIYLSYSKILHRLKIQNIKTAKGKEITEVDLRQAIIIMNKKHYGCRWKQRKIKGNRCYILIEGYYWLIYVYFQNDKKQIDADIDFFTLRIKQYEELLNIQSKTFWNEDMYIYSLPDYFNKVKGTVLNGITKLNKATDKKYLYYENEKQKISKEGIEWLCKNCFKQKYLELLEDYKMDLTEKYILAGYPYDVF
ncbi:MAG: hypothetical protein HFJ20_08495 [Clostridia bacterium]|nr:hypothetical protein [Clostridia bacterium]